MKTLKRKSIRNTSPSEVIGVATAFILAIMWKSFLGYSMFFGALALHCCFECLLKQLDWSLP